MDTRQSHYYYLNNPWIGICIHFIWDFKAVVWIIQTRLNPLRTRHKRPPWQVCYGAAERNLWGRERRETLEATVFCARVSVFARKQNRNQLYHENGDPTIHPLGEKGHETGCLLDVHFPIKTVVSRECHRTQLYLDKFQYQYRCCVSSLHTDMIKLYGNMRVWFSER